MKHQFDLGYRLQVEDFSGVEDVVRVEGAFELFHEGEAGFADGVFWLAGEMSRCSPSPMATPHTIRLRLNTMLGNRFIQLFTNPCLSAAIVAIALVSCSESGSVPPVDFTVPTGFHGIFILREDPKASESLKLKEGRYLVDIPTSGIATVKSAEPLYHWHAASRLTWRPSPNGQTVASEYQLWSLFTTSEREHYYLVGTQAECNRAQKVSAFKLKPAQIPQ